MQVFGDMSANGKLMAVVIIVIVLVAIGGLGLLAFRLTGRRLSTGANGRTRQPRLGVVDAYDLDRQRQLVIVRRDNVEHLLMIGGPNDLLIESAIVRAAASAPPLRDKEPAPPAIPSPSQSPPSQGPTPVAAVVPSPGIASQASSAPMVGEGAQPPAIVPLPPRPVEQTASPPTQRPSGPSALPPRPAPAFPARPALAGAGSNTASPAKPVFPPPGRSGPAPRPSAPPVRPATPPGPTSSAAPSPAPGLRVGEPKTSDEPDAPAPAAPQTEPAVAAINRQAPDVAVEALSVKEPSAPPKGRPEPRIDPPLTPRGTPLPPLRAVPPAGSPAQPQPSVKVAPVPSLDALESLEEEMAKLLGRPAPPAEKL